MTTWTCPQCLRTTTQEPPQGTYPAVRCQHCRYFIGTADLGRLPTSPHYWPHVTCWIRTTGQREAAKQPDWHKE